MRVIIIFLILLSVNIIMLGQTNINNLEQIDGVWHLKGDSIAFTGDFEERYNDGSIKGTGKLLGGQLAGLRMRYYENGNKRSEGYYKDGYFNGHYKEFYPSGLLKQEGGFIDDKEHGTWIIYYPNQEKKVVLNFDNGIQEGFYYEYDENSHLTKQLFFKNGEATYCDDFLDLVNKASEMKDVSLIKDVIQLYDKALTLNPTVAEIYFLRGIAHSNNFNFEKAISDYDKLIEISPFSMEAYANRGNAKLNKYRSDGGIVLSDEEKECLCSDFYKARELGDKTRYTKDMIHIHCKKRKKKEK